MVNENELTNLEKLLIFACVHDDMDTARSAARQMWPRRLQSLPRRYIESLTSDEALEEAGNHFSIIEQKCTALLVEIHA